MKPSEFKLLLAAVADVVGRDDAEKLLQLAPLFELEQFKSVADVAKRLQSGADTTPETSHLPIVRTLRKLERLFSKFGKPAAAKDVEIVTRLVAASHDPDVRSFVESALEKLRRGNLRKAPKQQVRADVIGYWRRLLERSLGDDVAFSQVLNEIENSDVHANEWVALAREFASAHVKGKAAALKRIKARHQAMLSAHAKAAATAGRIAG